MIAGIIVVAASDELTVAHPGERSMLASIALVLGETGLFLAGQAFFKWAISGLLPWSRVVAIAALATLIPVGGAVPALALSAAAALIVVVLAVLGHPGR
jgi:low temperature requirement protein LtrA